MSHGDRYIKLVYWSEEDQAYIGRSPGLFEGDVRGLDEAEVFIELCREIESCVEAIEEDGFEPPPPTAQRSYSGKFNLRVGKELHEQLSLEALRGKESLNALCVRLLGDGLSRT
ncbi:MAG: toxin-antitoxin system HicB family antitoxin [Xanthomonadales bacterium]|nr:toxin-antitoxin system HicB family antitoxin [Xanthomonadales bacterium]